MQSCGENIYQTLFNLFNNLSPAIACSTRSKAIFAMDELSIHDKQDLEPLSETFHSSVKFPEQTPSDNIGCSRFKKYCRWIIQQETGRI